MTIIARVHGLGIGNYLFQYAAAYSLAKMHNSSFSMDFTTTRASAQIGPTSRLSIEERDKFIAESQIACVSATSSDVLATVGPSTLMLNLPRGGERLFTLLSKPGRVFTPVQGQFDDRYLSIEPPVYLNGFFNSPHYFEGSEETIKSLFGRNYKLNSVQLELKQRITQSNSVSVHIRRGDYTVHQFTQGKFPLLDDKYAQAAIDIIENQHGRTNIFVFSDDIEWAESNILKDRDPTFVSKFVDNPWVDLEMMRSCKHNVIANSTYSWWGAYLNNNQSKMVICPKVWRTDGYSESHLNQPGWVIL